MKNINIYSFEYYFNVTIFLNGSNLFRLNQMLCALMHFL